MIPNSNLPKKIFNRCKEIPFGIEIYKSRKGGIYFFAGVRDKRKGFEAVMYTIPNNIKPECPNIKGIQRKEMDTLWSFLLINRVITNKKFENMCPDLFLEGKCCKAGFYGIINFLFPDTFSKDSHCIRFKY